MSAPLKKEENAQSARGGKVEGSTCCRSTTQLGHLEFTGDISVFFQVVFLPIAKIFGLGETVFSHLRRKHILMFSSYYI